MAVGAPQPPPL